MSKRNKKKRIPAIGWREWIALPDLGVEAIKVKVDTGARTSALHAFDVEIFEENGIEMVRFNIHPDQSDTEPTIPVTMPLLEHRAVTSSTGHKTDRPTIRTVVELFGRRWPIEITLTNRDDMGFRMLLGRQAVRRRFLVDPARSFLAGEREKRKTQA